MLNEKVTIAGMSLKGGRKDQFFFCLLEFFPDKDRWFLRSLLQVKDEETGDGNKAIRKWISDYGIQDLVVDFPLCAPACHTCTLECPGAELCPDESVAEVRKRIKEILETDKTLNTDDPKKYERERNKDDEFDYYKNVLNKEPHEHLLSRSFKRRLKKGFIPYWNRSVDYWVWKHYYDALLELFNITYDSFGNMSLMLQSRFSYLRRHFPRDLKLYEGNIAICLIELLRSEIIPRRDIINLNDMEMTVDCRMNIVREIEKNLKIFIYDSDLETIVKNPRAFDSFLLAVVGQCVLRRRLRILPNWTGPSKTHFSVPIF
jgi:hypothetical protein